ncbi:hypothetical protein [Corynebacterium propinquum]
MAKTQDGLNVLSNAGALSAAAADCGLVEVTGLSIDSLSGMNQA